jgi:DNA-binding NtrC family response regulator
MGKILIVEDEAILAFKTEMDLVRLGHKVVGMTDNGADAVKITKERHPDIVLMDIVLKGNMNGIEATEEINKDNGCSIIYMTGHSDAATIEMARQTKHVCFLFKPVESYQLKEAIEVALK